MAAAMTATNENMDISKLKVPDLKRELKLRGLSATGNKNELMERLLGALSKAKMEDSASAESVDDLDEDLLNDDELDQEPLETPDSVLNDIDLDTTVPVTTPKRKLSEDSNSNKQTKKVVLNRSSISVEEPIEEKQNGCSVETKSSIEEDKKVVKLSELSAKERLEMRAKKFGTPLTAEGQKLARAERFKGGSKDSIGTSESASVDVLKKRAERFGGSVSTVMSKLEQEDRLKKRQERFGANVNSNGSLTAADKAKQRLERFKQTAT